MDDSSIIETVLSFGLFDAAWYLQQYPDVHESDLSPADHFARHGFREGRDPHPLFLSSWYHAGNPDVGTAQGDALAHFVADGGSEGRSPHPFVANKWLRAQLPPALPFDNPLLGYLSSAPAFGPRPLFDIALMRTRLGLPDTATAAETMSAWLALPPGRRPDPHLLVLSRFIERMGGVAPGQDPVAAFLESGGHRSWPHPLFDNDQVWAAHPFLHDDEHGLTLVERAIASGRLDEVDTSPLFDRDHYRRALPREERTRAAAVLHYLDRGAFDGRDPNPCFDETLYRERYLRDAPGLAGLVHYAMSFNEPHITLAPRFPDRCYVSRYPQVADPSYGSSPLEHYLRFGRYEGRRPSRPAWHDDFVSWEEVRRDIRRLAAVLPERTPEVSVVIAAHGQFRFTLRCVWSLLRTMGETGLQVIVADDASPDETEPFFGGVAGLTYLRNAENLGFLRTCNAAAEQAAAPYLLFLNNDTAVLPGAVQALLATARALPDAGLVGAKLLYPDGTLQEAGGYIWNDGTGANLGRHGDPDHPGYNMRRDADYISGAAILVPRPLWTAMGGFDERYVPAYCEDSDLALRLRQSGWRVLYEPAAQIVHFEGVSSGTSTASGVKAYQPINQAKLLDRWRFALEAHLPPTPVSGESVPRAPRPRILVVDAIVPEPDQDAGSVTAVWYLRLLTELGYEVSFLPTNLLPSGRYGDALRAIGVTVLHAPYVRDVGTFLDAHAAGFDVVLLYRVTTSGAYLERLRGRCGATRLIFDTVDLHFLRAEREAARHGNPEALVAEAAALRARELHVMDQADATVLLSGAELRLLQGLGHKGNFSVIPLVLENTPHVPPRAGRTGIAFVGGFQHTPNVDAVLHFMAEIHPLLRAADPTIEVHIVGSRPPAAIQRIDCPGVTVHGFVEDLDGFLDRRIATIVPLQYGAGIKGKIGSSFAAGVPVVSTAVGAEGMALRDGEDLLLADTPAAFVAAILRVVHDEALWTRLSQAGRRVVEETYSARVTRGRLLRLLAQAGAVPFTGTCPITGEAEVRRFLEDGMADSLSAIRGGTCSSERVLAHALSVLAGESGTALRHLGQGALPPLRCFGAVPVLEAALARMGVADGAPALAIGRVVQDEAGLAQLAAMLRALPETVARLALACPAPGKTPTGPRPAPYGLTAMVAALEADGWDCRCVQVPLKECAITDVPLLEARRRGAGPGHA